MAYSLKCPFCGGVLQWDSDPPKKERENEYKAYWNG